MVRKRKTDQLFYEYFEEWIELYKVGAVRTVTLNDIRHRKLPAVT